MMMRCLWCAYFLSLYGGLQAIERIDFQHLDQYTSDQEVYLRGFLYATDDAQLILSSEPALKSCCVGSTAKRERQVYVFGAIEAPLHKGSVVDMQGTFVVEKIKGQEGRRYRLENASFIERDNPSRLWVWILGALAAFSLGVVIWGRLCRKR